MDIKKTLEPTRPLQTPSEDEAGNLRATTTLSSKSNVTRARLPIPPTKIMPVIIVAGIMGSNLRATTDPNRPKNRQLDPGEMAWRPPNGKIAGISEASRWRARSPEVRQRILDGRTLEVDPNGHIELNAQTIPLEVARERGWGEIHSDSYGGLLLDLQTHLNYIFANVRGHVGISRKWQEIEDYDRLNWGVLPQGVAAKLSEEELKHAAKFHYPIYGFGYNWLETSEISSDKLLLRIISIIEEWKLKKRNCENVILLTHSMGGLVGRACAKKSPEKILGIIHGVMPSLGAPACFRRLACGTEADSPSNSWDENIAAGYFADIAGRTQRETTPVLSTSPGPLELLPNHNYPRPWLFASYTVPADREVRALELPEGDPYDLYRDENLWYRPIISELADPANMYGVDINETIAGAVNKAEKFHKKTLGEFYHKNSYAIFADDVEKLSFGSFTWLTSVNYGWRGDILKRGALREWRNDGSRMVAAGGADFHFTPSKQNVAGDGTVPSVSANGARDKVRQLFRTTGYSHQQCYNEDVVLNLSLQLIVKIMRDH